MAKSKERKLENVSEHLYRKYAPHKNDMRERWKIFADGVALSLPLLAAFSWYVSLIFRSTVPGSDVYLSPGKTEPMIVFILVFIVGYSVFLVIEYSILKKRLEKVGKRQLLKKLH